MFEPGAKVFAKVKGFPHWPARVLGYSEDTKKFTLFYYGTHETGFLKPEDVCDYNENKEKYGTKKRRDVLQAVEEMENNPDICYEENIPAPAQPPPKQKSETPARKATKMITVESPVGDICEIHYDHDRPDTFPSEEAEKKWEAATQDSLKRLREDFQTGKFQIAEWALPPSHRVQKEDVEDKKVTKLKWLRREVELLDLHVKVKDSLSVKQPNCQTAIECLEALLKLDVAPLMLKKHPYVLDTVSKLKRYVGPKSVETNKEEILKQAEVIRHKAEQLFNKFCSLFVVPEGKTFNEIFVDQIVEYQRAVFTLSEEERLILTRDPRPCLASATVFYPGKSYTYEYNAWLKAAIPELNEQYAGVHLKGKLIIEAESDQTLVLALQDLEARKFNEEVGTNILENHEQWKNLGEPVTIVGAQCLEKPITVNFRGMVFESLTVGSNDPLWCVNFKKGLASKVQLILKGSKGSKGSMAAMENLKAGEMVAYSLSEECVTGECETWYEITELPEERIKSEPNLIPSPELCKGSNFFQIVKTRDFDKCKRPTILARISPIGWRCAVDSAVCGGAKSRLSTQRITACEGRQGELVIQRHVVADIRNVQPYGTITEPMKAKTFVMLQLRGETSGKSIATRGQAAGGQRIDSLLYVHTPSQQHGGPVPKPGLTDSLRLGGKRMDPSVLAKEIRRLITEVVRDMESKEFYTNPSTLGVSDKLGMIRRAAAFLNYEELRSVFSKELNMDEDSTQFQVAKDCLVACGTNPAIMLIKEMIVKKKLTGERARQALAVLPITIKTPTREILSELFDLLDSKVVNDDEQMEVTLALSLATIAHQACVNQTVSRSMYPVAVMGPFCSPSEPLIVRKLIPYLSSRIRKAESNGEKIAFITALSNLGHESIIPILIPIIEGSETGTSGYSAKDRTKMFEDAKSARTRHTRSIFKSRGLEEEEEELGLSKRNKKKNYGVPEWESMGMGQRQFGGFESGMEEEEFELSSQERRRLGIPDYVTSLNKGLLHKYGVPEHEIAQMQRKNTGYRGMNPASGYGMGGAYEEEEEYELSPSQFTMYNIPQSEAKINKGVLRKYGVPEHQMSTFKKRSSKSSFGGGRSGLGGYEEEEIQLTSAEKRRFGIPETEKINTGILRKYGVSEDEIMNLERKNRQGGTRSARFEEEEEYDLSESERQKWGIPSHETTLNKGLLHKYGVPEHEIRKMKSRGSKEGSKFSLYEEDEEIELHPSVRQRYGIPMHEKINKGILKKYEVPEHEVTGSSKRQWSTRFEEEEEELELSPAIRQKYGVPMHENINKGILKKYGVPEHQATSKRGSGSRQFEEEEELELSPSIRQKYGVPMHENINKGILKKYGVPEHEATSKRGSGSRRSEYEEDEELELSPSIRQKYGVPMHENINKGILKKYGVPEHEAFSKRGFGSRHSQWEEEEELELSPSARQKYGIPMHENINKGILKKYGVPEHEAFGKRGSSQSRSQWEEEEELELSPSIRQKYGVPMHENINKGILKKYGVPEHQATSKRGSGSRRSQFEEEEELELSPSIRQKYGVPMHENINKGILKKYGVPEHEAYSKHGSGARRSQWEEEEEFEISPEVRRRYGIPMHEQINKSILKRYNVPEHEARSSKRRGSFGGYAFEEEEEYELSPEVRRRYGVPSHENISKDILKKYGIPHHEASRMQGKKGGESDWYQEKQHGARAKKHFGRKTKKTGAGKSEYGNAQPEEETEENEITVRAKAVFALQKLAHAHNPKAMHVLKTVYFNVNEDPEVRMAALNMIIHGNPNAEVWQRIAVGTWFEPSKQVHSFVLTSLMSIQNMEDPVVRNMALKAKAVLPLAKPIDLGFLRSANILLDAHDYSNSEGFIFHASTFFGKTSFLPTNLYMKLNVNNGPFRIPQLLEASVSGRNYEAFVDEFINKMVGKTRSTGQNAELHKIKQMLNIAPRGNAQPEAFVHAKLLDGIQRFWEVDEDIFSDFYSEFAEYFKSRGKDINYRKWIPLRDVYISAPSEVGIPFLVNIHFKGLTSINGNVNASAAGLEADINPTVAFKFVSQIGFDVPFVDKYVAAGVDTHLHLALPTSLAVKLDTTRGQASVEWEPTKGRVSMVHYHVKPFTATKDSFDFTPITQVPELQEITVHPSPKEITIPLSSHFAVGAESDFMGLNVVLTHKSDTRHATQVPNLVNILSDIKEGKSVNWLLPESLRLQETKVIFDTAASETKGLRVLLDLSTASTTNVASNTVIRSGSERPLESAKGRTVANIVGKLNQNQEQRLVSWFEKYSGGVATFVDVSAELIGNQNRKVEASVGVGSSFMGHMQKLQIEVGKAQAANKFCFDTEVEWPKLTSLKREYYLGADIATSLNIKAGYGKTCQNQNKVILDVDGKLTRSPQMAAEIKSMPETKECAKEETVAEMMLGSRACEKARRIATDLDRYEFDIDISNVPEIVANISYKVEDLLIHLGSRYMSHNRVDVTNTKKQIKVVLEVTAEEESPEISLKIFKPNSNLFFQNVRMGPISRALLPVNVRLPFVANVMNTLRTCAVESDKVSTFDNVIFEAPLSGCDHVIAKDCSGRRKVALLGREESGNKIATILTENDKITIHPATSTVLINGKEHVVTEDKWVIVKDETGYPVVSLRKTRDGFIEALGQKYGIKVSVSPNKILVWGVGWMRGTMCGICGNREGETVSDLEGPRGTTLSSGKHLVAAYMLDTPRNCDPKGYENVQKEAIREEEQSLRNVPYSGLARAIKTEGVHIGSPLGASVSQMGSTTGCTTFKNKMLSRGGLKCFTKITLPDCRPGCKPVNTIEKRVGLHCVQKGRFADKLAQELQTRALTELRNEEEHVTEKINVPTGCIEA